MFRIIRAGLDGLDIVLKALDLLVIILVVYFALCISCCVSRLFMEELVNYIHRFPLSEKSAFWKDEQIQK